MHLHSHAQRDDSRQGSAARTRPDQSESAEARQSPFGATILRKASCACGGGCSACQNNAATVRREKTYVAPNRVPDSVNAALHGNAKPLPDPLRQRAELFFHADLSHVRIHDHSLAATAAAESRAHALSVGSDIILSRGRSDLTQPDSQKTLAHEIAHSLQPDTGSTRRFEPDNSPAETEASSAAESFVANDVPRNRPSTRRMRTGVVRERDPRLDSLVGIIDELPRVLTSEGIADELNSAAPSLDLDDPDNYEPLRLLLDDHFGQGTGDDALAAWRHLRSAATERAPETTTATTTATVTSTPQPVEQPREIVSSVPPGSMRGEQLESEIALLRTTLGLPPLVEDAPTSDFFEPTTSEDQLRLDRLLALEAEYYDRRRLLEAARTATAAIAEEQRTRGPNIVETIVTSAALANPALAPLALGIQLGSPAEDFLIGFVPGFLGGAMLELPRDIFTRLDTEVREHPFLYNGGVLVGVPVGALEGLRDLIVGLADLIELASRLSPTGMTLFAVEETARLIGDEGHLAERERQLAQAQAVGEAIVQLIVSMLRDRAFMLVHGEELGEIAGRASARWFSTDFMAMDTFDKGYLIGKIEGRILFEILALFLGPEEWIARGGALIGQGIRISGRLSRALIELIERIPALRRLMTILREGSVAAREAAAAERALAETGEAISDASRLAEEAGDVGRAADRAEDLSDPARLASGALDPADLRRVGEVNPETMQFFQRHPDRLRGWAENPVARRACKLCSSPCFPENVTQAQAREIESLLQRAESQGLRVDDHILHDGLAPMNEQQINSFIRSFENHLDEMPTDLTRVVDDATEAAASRSPGAPEELAATPDPTRTAEAAELPSPQRLRAQVGSPESRLAAIDAGVPADILGDSTVMTRADFPEVIPDLPPGTSRTAPAPLEPITALDDLGRPVEMRPVSRSELQATDLLQDYDALVRAGADPATIRINQMQIVDDMRVGTNRPDLYAELNGRRILIEYDRAPGTRAIEHARRILSNDPDAIIILKIIDFD